jgi:hypothetical protein
MYEEEEEEEGWNAKRSARITIGLSSSLSLSA